MCTNLFYVIKTWSIFFIKKLLIFLCVGLRPFFGPTPCRYAIGCTAFACYQLETQPLGRALWSIIKRLLTCNPLYIMR